MVQEAKARVTPGIRRRGPRPEECRDASRRSTRHERDATRQRMNGKTCPGSDFERQVFKLQKRIYRASRRGDVKTVHRLQRLLMKSWAAKVPRRQEGDAGQPRQEDRRGRWGEVPSAPPNGWRWRATLRSLPRPAHPPGLDPQARQSGAAAAGHPDHARPRRANAGAGSPWNPNGRLASSRTATGSAQDAPATMRSRRSTTASAQGRSTSSTPTSRSASTASTTTALLRKLAHLPDHAPSHHGPGSRRRAGRRDAVPHRRGTPQGGAISPLLANIALHGLEDRHPRGLPRRTARGGHTGSRWWSATPTTSWSCTRTWRSSSRRSRSPRVAGGHGAGTEAEQDPDRPHPPRAGRARAGSTSWGSPSGSSRSEDPLRPGTRTGQTGLQDLIKPSPTATATHLADIAEVVRRHRATPQAT